MTTQALTPEQIEANFNKFRSLCEKLGDRSEAALNLVDSLGEKLALSPASGKKEYHLAIPGGLADHSLRVLGNAMRLVKTFGWNISKESLIISCLFHDIGKVGLVLPDGEVQDYYVQADDWLQKRGEMFTYNKEMQYMTTQQRSMHLLQHFGIKLSPDEYLAILLNDGFVVDDNKSYCLKISPLVFAVQTADYISTMQEKATNGWDES